MAMKSPLEKTFQAKVSKKLKTLRSTYFVKVSDRVQNGVPDVLCCIAGKFVALELKRDAKSKATPLQVWTLEQIVDARGLALVVHPGNWAEVWEMLFLIAGGTKDMNPNRGNE